MKSKKAFITLALALTLGMTTSFAKNTSEKDGFVKIKKSELLELMKLKKEVEKNQVDIIKLRMKLIVAKDAISDLKNYSTELYTYSVDLLGFLSKYNDYKPVYEICKKKLTEKYKYNLIKAEKNEKVSE